MSIVVPKGRKHLSADALFRLLRSGFDHIPDHRSRGAEMSLADALMSAFAMLSLTSPSPLAFDKQRAEGNLESIYGIERVPCDTQMRAIFHPVSPELLRPLCKSVFVQLQRGKALEPMVCLDGHSLLALDGTGYFSSKTMHCASCLHKVHRNGSVTYAHQMLGAAILHPDVRAAEHAEHVTYYARHDRQSGMVHRFRCINQVPLHASHADVRVNCIAYWEMSDDKVQHCSWVTDVRVSKRHVFHLIRGGRARWKIENEACNTLKNQGYHFEYNDGHGTKKLSVVFAMVMLLAFLGTRPSSLAAPCSERCGRRWAASVAGGSACERYSMTTDPMPCENYLQPCFTATRSLDPS